MGTTKDAPCNSEEVTWGLGIEGGETPGRSSQRRDVPVPGLHVHIIQHVEDRRDAGVAATQ